MLVGAAREIINPEVGHCLCGYGETYPNSGVHDDLAVMSLYLNDGHREALLLNFDLIGLNGTTQRRFRDAISQVAGIGAEFVFLACTHVHSGPNVAENQSLAGTPPAPNCRADYMERLLDWACKAARASRANAEECQLRYNFTYVEENMNRRYNFPDRRFFYIPDHKQLLGLSREYVDRELGIVAFRKKGSPNRYKAVLTNYTSHPLCVGNSSNLVTADYHGVMRRRVEETFEGCLCLSTTGAAGDNHPLTPEGGFVAAEIMGSNLGRQAITRVYDSTAADFDDQLRLSRSKVTLQLRDQATQQMLPEKDMREKPLGRQGAYDVEVTLLGIGPVLLAGFPGEPVSELGAMLKWSSPFLKTYVLFTATDNLCYFPTMNQFHWGGYEPGVSWFACGSGEKLVGHILAEAGRLIAQQPLRLPPIGSPAVDGHPR
jgi:neutral ceramidase